MIKNTVKSPLSLLTGGFLFECVRSAPVCDISGKLVSLRISVDDITKYKQINNNQSKLLSKYFEKKFENNEQRYIINSELRRQIIFGHHDLTKNAPMSKIDLLVCRNVLIYLKPETQASVLVRFHFALNHNGFLFLGRTESLIKSENIFSPISIKHRIFVKGEKLTLEQHLLILPTTRRKNKVIMSKLTDET